MLNIKLELIMATLCISFVKMQGIPERVFDFNSAITILQFEQCDNPLPLFAIKSYTDVPQLSGSNSSFHLSNRAVESCMKTKETFDMNETTVIAVRIYLKSNVVDDSSFVDIVVYDVYVGQFSFRRLAVSSNEDWRVQDVYVDAKFAQAKIQIVAMITPDAILAIEYLGIFFDAATTTPNTTPTDIPSTLYIPSTTQYESSTTQTSAISTEATKKPYDGRLTNIFNIYNFAASYFNFTSKITN